MRSVICELVLVDLDPIDRIFRDPGIYLIRCFFTCYNEFLQLTYDNQTEARLFFFISFYNNSGSDLILVLAGCYKLNLVCREQILFYVLDNLFK